jgi:hypothetical protein
MRCSGDHRQPSAGSGPRSASRMGMLRHPGGGRRGSVQHRGRP